MKIEERPTVDGGGGSSSSISAETPSALPQNKNRKRPPNGVALKGVTEPVVMFETHTKQYPLSIDLEARGRKALTLQAGREFTDAEWATKRSRLVEFVRTLHDWDRKKTR